MRNLGVEEGDIVSGNVGFEIEATESYFAREQAENRLAEGFPVSDDFLPTVKSQYEKDLYRRQKEMERMETARTWNRFGERADSAPLDKAHMIMESYDDRQERLFKRFGDDN